MSLDGVFLTAGVKTITNHDLLKAIDRYACRAYWTPVCNKLNFLPRQISAPDINYVLLSCNVYILYMIYHL